MNVGGKKEDMMKQRLIATGIIFLAWSLLEWFFHGFILMGDYAATAHLWRPMAEMNMPLMVVIRLVTSLLFVLIYCQVVSEKNMTRALKLGGITGLMVGLSGGLGSYAYMPITLKIAVVWTVAIFANFLVAGAIVGKVVTKELH